MLSSFGIGRCAVRCNILKSNRCFSSGLENNVRERIVILGTGWGGYNLAKSIQPASDREVIVISPSNHFVFTPLLPSTAVGTVEFRAIQEPVRSLSTVDKYFHGKAKRIDFDNQEIMCDADFKNERFKVKYDKLIVSVGVKTNTFNIPNVAEREGIEVYFLKHLFHARSLRNRTVQMFEYASMPNVTHEERRRLLHFVIVGGGPTSCEYAAELHDFLKNDMSKLYPHTSKYVKISLVEAGDTLLGPFDENLRDYVMKLFSSRNIDVRLNTAVTGVNILQKDDYQLEASKCSLSDGSELEFGTMVWSAGLSPVKFTDRLPDTIEKTKQGRLLVDPYLRVKGQEGKVWAIGDCAELEETPLPQLAQVANQQASYLANIFNGKSSEATKRFQFYSLGSMASLGDGVGVYDGSHAGNPYGVDLFKFPKLRGFAAWLMWRTAYWGKQISFANQLLIPVYWFKSWVFGRDISRF
mmetsp:Transcript_17130/g.22243  ORF Transcript_17130/g.22243 Transcript_17130/m.22243 type:complete len:468 (-) Transcript_17130:65-1468(-)